MIAVYEPTRPTGTKPATPCKGSRQNTSTPNGDEPTQRPTAAAPVDSQTGANPLPAQTLKELRELLEAAHYAELEHCAGRLNGKTTLTPTTTGNEEARSGDKSPAKRATEHHIPSPAKSLGFNTPSSRNHGVCETAIFLPVVPVVLVATHAVSGT